MQRAGECVNGRWHGDGRDCQQAAARRSPERPGRRCVGVSTPPSLRPAACRCPVVVARRAAAVWRAQPGGGGAVFCGVAGVVARGAGAGPHGPDGAQHGGVPVGWVGGGGRAGGRGASWWMGWRPVAKLGLDWFAAEVARWPVLVLFLRGARHGAAGTAESGTLLYTERPTPLPLSSPCPPPPPPCPRSLLRAGPPRPRAAPHPNVPCGRGQASRRLAAACGAARPLDAAGAAVQVRGGGGGGKRAGRLVFDRRLLLRMELSPQGPNHQLLCVPALACASPCCLPPHPCTPLCPSSPFPRRLATRLWDWGVTPGSIVRGMGPWGPSVTQKYCRSRFTRQKQLTEAEVAVFEQVGGWFNQGCWVFGGGCGRVCLLMVHAVAPVCRQAGSTPCAHRGVPNAGPEASHHSCSPASLVLPLVHACSTTTTRWRPPAPASLR